MASSGGDKSSGGRGRRRWGRALLVAVVVVLVLYTLGGFFGVPAAVKYAVGGPVSERLVGAASVDRVAFNPYTFALELERLNVADADGRSVIALDRFEGQFRPIASIIEEGWRFDHVRVFGPRVEIDRLPDGTLNMASLVAPSPAGAGPSEPLREIPRVVVRDVAVEGGEVVFRDLAFDPPFEKRLSGLAFGVDTLDTEPSYGNPHRFDARLGDDASVTWQGTAFADPLTASGSLAVEGLDLAGMSVYLRERFGLILGGGTLSLSVEYALAPTRAGERLRIPSAQVTLSGLDLTLEGRPLVAASSIRIVDVRANAGTREFAVGSILVDGLDATVRRTGDGGLEVMTLIPRGGGGGETDGSDVASTEGAGAGTDAPAEPQYPIERLASGFRSLLKDLGGDWSVDIEDVEVGGTSIAWTDASTAEPASAKLENVSLRAGPLSSGDGFRTSFEFAADVASGGRVEIRGEADPAGPSVDVALAVAGLSAAPALPYLPSELPEPLTGARLEAASVSLDGRAVASLAEPLSAQWEGRAEIAGVRTTMAGGAPPVQLESLESMGLLTVSLNGSATEVAWNGGLGVVGLSANVPGETPIEASLGGARVDGELLLGITDAGPDVAWSGTGAVTSLRAAAGGGLEAEVAVSEGTVSGSTFRLTPEERTLSIATLALTGPDLRAVRRVLAEAEEDAAATGEGMEGGPVLAVSIDQVRLTDGAFGVTDATREPPLEIEGSEVSFTASGLDTAGGKAAEIDLSTRLAEAGRLGVTGSVDPFRQLPFVDVAIRLENMPLRPFSPAAEPQLGFEIRSGRLTLDMPLRVEEGQLEGRLGADLDSFYLGDKVPSETAPNLPIKLGLDLLRDANDSIRADIGISGDTTSPTFSFGGMIWDAAFTLLGNVATSPFRIIGGLVGAGEDVDLSLIAFAPGSGELDAESLRKIDLLTEALRKRPALGLTIRAVPGVGDIGALREGALSRQLAAAAADGNVDGAGALETLFARTFPGEGAVRVPVPPGRPDQDAPSPERMRERLLAAVELPEEAVAELTRLRAERVLRLLVQNGVDEGRVETADAAEDPGEQGTVAFEILGN